MLRKRRWFVVGAQLSAALVIAAGCMGQDFSGSPLSLSELDHGWLVTVEPGEKFDIGLKGNAAYPDLGWQVVDFDPAVIELRDDEQVPLGDPEGVDFPVAPVSVFFFEAVALGATPLAFEFVVDGEPIDVAEYSVAVVDDACEAGLGAVANRCGLAFSYQPQDLTELDHGQAVALEPGATLELTLTANALHPESPWEVTAIDADVIGIDGPIDIPADRQRGDWGPWEPDSRHSFLPAWTFAIEGIGLGESELVLELPVGDVPLDRYVLTVAVVEDSCDTESYRSTCDQ